jgi:hypothetical protein
MLSFVYAECHLCCMLQKAVYAECGAECHYAECHGAHVGVYRDAMIVMSGTHTLNVLKEHNC